MPPRPHGVEADHEEAVRAVHGLDRLPLALELDPRRREARRKRVGDVVVAGEHEKGGADAPRGGETRPDSVRGGRGCPGTTKGAPRRPSGTSAGRGGALCSCPPPTTT